MKLLKPLRFLIVFFCLLLGIPFLLAVLKQRLLPPLRKQVISSGKSPYAKVIKPSSYDRYHYKLIEGKLVQLAIDKDPRIALTQLAEELPQNKSLLDNCHGVTHAIGHAAYEKYQDVSKALQYSDEICGSGYIHGVIEERILKSKDVYTELKTMCEPDSGNCYHGIGHGLMYYTSNDLPQALKYCDTLFDDKAKVFCSEGVFMENFNTDEDLHPSKYLDKNNPFYPCSEQGTLYKGACYFYAPDYYLKLHEGDFAGVLRLCDSVESGFQVTCLNGVGSRAMKRNIDTPQVVEKLCMTLEENRQKYCVDGMVGYYIVHYYSLAKGRELCTLLEEKNKAQCYLSVESRKSMFPE